MRCGGGGTGVLGLAASSSTFSSLMPWLGVEMTPPEGETLVTSRDDAVIGSAVGVAMWTSWLMARRTTASFITAAFVPIYSG